VRKKSFFSKKMAALEWNGTSRYAQVDWSTFMTFAVGAAPRWSLRNTRAYCSANFLIHRYIKLKKHLMTGQSQCFADCRLVRSSFQKWRTASADRDEEKIKTGNFLFF